jgi:hypothetical protein
MATTADDYGNRHGTADDGRWLYGDGFSLRWMANDLRFAALRLWSARKWGSVDLALKLCGPTAVFDVGVGDTLFPWVGGVDDERRLEWEGSVGERGVVGDCDLFCKALRVGVLIVPYCSWILDLVFTAGSVAAAFLLYRSLLSRLVGGFRATSISSNQSNEYDGI